MTSTYGSALTPRRLTLPTWINLSSSTAQPNIKQIDANNSYLEYRVTGDFIKTFDFTNYPFESHTLFIELEHENLDNTQLIYDIDSTSYIEPTAGVSGWIRR